VLTSYLYTAVHGHIAAAAAIGLYRDAEKQFKSAIKDQDMIMTNLELIKVSI
jgi:hypothetical protein